MISMLKITIYITFRIKCDFVRKGRLTGVVVISPLYFRLFRFFQQNPDYQKLFPEFRDVDPSELQNTSALYGHAKRVMKAVENAVSSLDDGFGFAGYLEELGRRHKSRALKPMYLDVRNRHYLNKLMH